MIQINIYLYSIIVIVMQLYNGHTMDFVIGVSENQPTNVQVYNFWAKEAWSTEHWLFYNIAKSQDIKRTLN